jgi:hypothetical protein
MTTSELQAEVIVDFVFDDGLFFIAIKNIGDAPAYDVSIKFDKKFTGVEGRKNISALPLFRNTPFLAPHKEIVTFLDSSESYFRRRQATNIRAIATYKDFSGAAHRSVARHDLSIYREIGYIRRTVVSEFAR